MGKGVAVVTGASGFLGGRLAKLLVESGEYDQVRVLARPISNLQHLQKHIDAGNVTVCTGDVTDPDGLVSLVDGAHVIFHCAGMSADWGRPVDFVRVNVHGPRNLLEAILSRPETLKWLQRFVHVSTVDIYGYPPDSENYNEETPGKDIGLSYNSSKLAGEQLVWRYFKEHGIPITVLRPSTIYGPRSKDFVSEYGQHILNGSMVLVDGGKADAGLVHVDVVARAAMKAAWVEVTLGQAYNINSTGDHGGVTWAKYLDLLARSIAQHSSNSTENSANTKSPYKQIGNRGSARLLRLAWVLEHFYWLTSRYGPGQRPLVTRHWVLFSARPQRFPTEKARKDFGFGEDNLIGPSLEEGVGEAARWFVETVKGDRK